MTISYKFFRLQPTPKMDENLELLITIPEVDLYEITPESRTLKEHGDLNLCYYPALNLVILCINDFRYALDENIPFMINPEDHQSVKRYAFPYIDSNMVIILPLDTTNQLVEIFETILAEKSNFVYSKSMVSENMVRSCDVINADKNDEQKMEEEHKNMMKVSSFDDVSLKKEEVEEEKEQKQQHKKIAEHISNGGDKIKAGLIRTGSFFSSQIQKGAQFLKKRMRKKEKEIKINPKTQQKVKFVKETSDKFMKFTSTQIENLVSISHKIGQKLTKNIGKNTSSQVKYQDAKNIGKASIHVVASVYNGLNEAIMLMVKGAREAGVEMVEHRYGRDMAGVLEDGMDIVDNARGMAMISNVVKAVVVDKIEKGTEVKNEEKSKIN